MNASLVPLFRLFRIRNYPKVKGTKAHTVGEDEAVVLPEFAQPQPLFILP